jgi:hypothetical protein
MGAVKSRTSISEPPPLPTKFTWPDYARLRELKGPVYEIAEGLFVYTFEAELTPTVEEGKGSESEAEPEPKTFVCIRFFYDRPFIAEGYAYLSCSKCKIVLEPFHNRGIETHEKLRPGLFGAFPTLRRRAFFDKVRVYDRPATHPHEFVEKKDDEFDDEPVVLEFLRFIVD